MTLDVRTPAGVMFVVLGALLVVYGLAGDAGQYQRSLGVNINVGWGLVMVGFGIGLLLWRRVTPNTPPPGGQ
jgi:protein-S-isoprenylcysteine O-methyltransferase Ste14